MSVCFFFLRLVCNYTLSGEQHTSDRSGIFKCNTANLSRIDHTCCKKVFIFFCTSIEAVVTFSFFNLLYND